MRTVKVHRDDLLKKLNENREKHQAIFDEACDGYQKEAEKILEAHLERVRKGRMTRVFVDIPVPENHTKDYDRIILMTEMSTESVIELDENQFSQYVMDDWIWKNQFLTSNSKYSATAASTLQA